MKTSPAADQLTAEDAIKIVPTLKTIFTQKQGEYELSTRHQFYYQVQGQLHITQRKYCIFALWTPLSIIHVRVEKDDAFWGKKMEEKLVWFYNACILPEILEPRHNKRMKIRDPDCIIQAKKQKKDSQSITNSQIISDTVDIHVEAKNGKESREKESELSQKKSRDAICNIELQKKGVTTREYVPYNENDLQKSMCILFNKNSLYPPNFPEIEKRLNGIIITAIDFRTLQPYRNMDQYITDQIIDGFFGKLPGLAEKSGMNLINFETFFVQKVLEHGYVSPAYYNWANRNQVWSKQVYILPINYPQNVHWTLLVIIRTKKLMVFIDSMHGSPNETILNGLCSFFNIRINEGWKLYVPKDIPRQGIVNRKTGEHTAEGNCGIHVCCWAHKLATGSKEMFSEYHMNFARKGIAKFLFEAEDNVLGEQQARWRQDALDEHFDEVEYRNYVINRGDRAEMLNDRNAQWLNENGDWTNCLEIILNATDLGYVNTNMLFASLYKKK